MKQKPKMILFDYGGTILCEPGWDMLRAELPAIHAPDGPDLLFCLISTEETTRMIWCGEGAEQAVRDSFPEYDGSGRVIFVPKASRKLSFLSSLFVLRFACHQVTIASKRRQTPSTD